MGTFETDNDLFLRLKSPTEVPELGFSLSASLSNADESFINNFRNVALKSDSSANVALRESGGPEGGSPRLPLRPYAGDCPFYIRTGTCKFGLSCRFNHPVKRSSLVSKGYVSVFSLDLILFPFWFVEIFIRGFIWFDDFLFKAVKENVNDWSSVNCGKIVCKYYLTPGGCKYGESCRYSHSKDESEIAGPELNFLGLPIRLGEKECPYYMRCGSCGYGARCVFHHPEPTSMGGFDSLKSTLDDKSMIQSGYSLGSSSSESASLLLTGSSHMDQAPWASYAVSNHFPYQNDRSAYMTMNSVAQGMQRHFEWNEYQASDSPHERSTQAYLCPGARADVLESDISVQGEEFPERPGQRVCEYFLKTGDCKFKSACRFHHPRDWVHKSDVCALSDKGLPLRPGKNVCRHYERFGICKFGRACLFDHPIDHKFSTYPVRSTSEPASSHDTGSWTN